MKVRVHRIVKVVLNMTYVTTAVEECVIGFVCLLGRMMKFGVDPVLREQGLL